MARRDRNERKKACVKNDTLVYKTELFSTTDIKN